MKRKPLSGALLALSCFAFFCLLLSGAPNLIGTENSAADEMLPMFPSGESFFTYPAQLQMESVFSAQTRTAEQGRENGWTQGMASCCAAAPVSDANGNILTSRSYMRAVYQAFVLSDGFV